MVLICEFVRATFAEAVYYLFEVVLIGVLHGFGTLIIRSSMFTVVARLKSEV
jgi:hypothetical protein